VLYWSVGTLTLIEPLQEVLGPLGHVIRVLNDLLLHYNALLCHTMPQYHGLGDPIPSSVAQYSGAHILGPVLLEVAGIVLAIMLESRPVMPFITIQTSCTSLANRNHMRKPETY
jgi:hypothetical protein